MSWDWHSPMTKWEVACNSVYTICSENCGFSPLDQINRKGNNILRGQCTLGHFVLKNCKKCAKWLIFFNNFDDNFKVLRTLPIFICTFLVQNGLI